MDWIHCNNCFIQPSPQNKSFILTNCGHIFCESCESQAIVDSTCKVCSRKCSTIKLSSQMKPDVQEYFNEPETMLQKVMQVIEFQKSHRSRLAEANKLLNEKYQRSKLYIKRLEDELKTLKREVEYYAKSVPSSSPVCNFRPPGLVSSPSPSACSKPASQFLNVHPVCPMPETNRHTDHFAKPNIDTYMQMHNRNANYRANLNDSQYSHGFSAYNDLRKLQSSLGRTPPMSNLKFPLNQSSSDLNNDELENLVQRELNDIGQVIRGSRINNFINELLSTHVKSIYIDEPREYFLNIPERENSSILKIPICGVNLEIHIYSLELEDIQSEVLTFGLDESNDAAVPAAKHCLLPTVHFQEIWENLLFDDDIKERLLSYATSTMIFSKHKIDQNIIDVNKVLLLYGPPGTGKTSLCKGLAQKLAIRFKNVYQQSEFIEINSHSLFSKYYSESGKLVMNMFSKIKDHLDYGKSLVFILIDEIESLTHSRNACMSGSEPTDSIRVVNAVLTQLDSIRSYPNVLILATSNLKTAIDTAFVDRADMQLFIGPPHIKSIYNIFISCIKELLRAGIVSNEENVFLLPAHLLPTEDKLEDCKNEDWLASINLLHLARVCEGFSGRVLRKIPFLAHSIYTQGDVGTGGILRYINAMHVTAKQVQRNNSNVLTIHA